MKTTTYRSMTANDREAYYQLERQRYMEQFGAIAISADETRAFSDIPGFELEADTRVAIQDNQFVGVIEVWALGDTPVHPRLEFYVVPDARGQGIEEKLLQWGLKRAEAVYERLPENARVLAIFKNAFRELDPVLERVGFKAEHQMMRMRIDFDTPPPEPQFPDGFRVVNMLEHPHLIDFVRVYSTAFQDLRGSTEDSLANRVARWQRDIEVHHEHFRPEYFLLLRDGDKDAGALLGWQSSRFDENVAWVSVLGILRDYRRRGLASNLLRHYFNLMYDIGRTGVGLSVDGSSLTGANKLYESVGMRPFEILKDYEFELRPGIELSNQG